MKRIENCSNNTPGVTPYCFSKKYDLHIIDRVGDGSGRIQREKGVASTDGSSSHPPCGFFTGHFCWIGASFIAVVFILNATQ